LCGFFSFLLMRFLSRFGRFSSFDLIWFFFFCLFFSFEIFFCFFFVFTYLFIDLFHFVFVFVISFVFVFWFIFTVEEDTAPWRADRLGPGRSKLGIERWTRPARDIFRDGHRPAFYNAPIRLFSKLGTKADECGQPPLRLGIGCGLGACVKCEPGRWWRHDAGGEERGQLTEDGCIDPNGIIGGGAPRCGGAILLAAPLPSSAFSSSRRFKQAAFGFRFLSLTRCSSCVMTSTAWWSTVNFGCDLSVLRWIWHIRPSSLNASFMSFTRTLISCQFANFVFVLFFFYCCFCIRICICFVYGRVCVFSISTAPSSACVDLRI